ncbi:hypothetical protein D1007_37860 [Hordeum vulgare]|nr:hypothetical protein D1007_37860 [Hordeum vulgare]
MPEMRAESALLSTNAAMAWFEGCRKFMYQHNSADAVNRGDFLVANSNISVCAWRHKAHSNSKDMMHHVWLCIERIPVYGWKEYVAVFVIDRKCSLDYIEPMALHREDTHFFSLWALPSNPNAIPKVKWLTLCARGHRHRGRRSLHHRMMLHLDLLEENSKALDDYNDPPFECQGFHMVPP